MSSALPSLSRDASLYVFHHVFLPPKLPQGDDFNDEHESTLLDTVIHALRGFKSHSPSRHGPVLDPVETMLDRLKKIRGISGGVNEENLKKVLEEMQTEGGLVCS